MSRLKPLYRKYYKGLANSILSHTRQIEKTILPTLELAYLRGKQYGEEIETKKLKAERDLYLRCLNNIHMKLFDNMNQIKIAVFNAIQNGKEIREGK